MDGDPKPPVVGVSVRRVIAVLLTVSVVLLALHVASRIVLASGAELTYEVIAILDRVNMDQEVSLPALYNTLLLVFASLLLFVLGWLSSGSARGWWIALGVVMTAASVDEAISLHELSLFPMQRLLGVHSGPFMFAWVVPGILVVGVLAVVFLRFFLSLPRATRLRIAVAGVIYLVGAVGAEMLGGAIHTLVGDPGTPQHLPAELLASLEEFLELLGAIAFIRALLLHLRDHTPARGLPAVEFR